MRQKLAAAAACGVVLVSALGAQAPPAPDAVSADRWYDAVRGAGPHLEALLIENPGAMNLRDRRGGVTPLMHAAALGSPDAVRRLLDAGADVNAKSAAGATALMWAAADPAKVRLLVDRGADVKAVSESGRTALLLAAMSDQSAATVRPCSSAARMRRRSIAIRRRRSSPPRTATIRIL
jgi:ankyrin repeat protein